MNAIMKEKIVLACLTLLTGAGVAMLFLILAIVIWKGAPALAVDFLLSESRDFGLSGGIFYQAVGTMILMAGAVTVCLPVALGTALFQTEYLKSPRLKRAFRSLIYSLNGVPTILFGLVGYMVFGVLLDTGLSWLTGSLILAVMILPTMEISIQQAIESLPENYREAGTALGLSPWQLMQSIVLPQSAHGIVTGILLGLARAGGETAAIMFTATTFSGVLFPQSFSDPVPTLQTHILILAQEAINPQAIANAWGAGLVLIAMVLLLTLGSLVLRARVQMESQR
jgi:phosphate transport system permease protein